MVRLILLLFASSLLPAAELDPTFQGKIQPLLKTYCLDCHNADKQKGDVDLSRFTSSSKVQADFKLWQTVLQQVEDEEMPPKKPLPTTAERSAIVAWVKQALDSIDWSKSTTLERVTLPRLTKAEYNNTLRDLLGIDFKPGDLLLDDGQGLSGFTNDRDALFISPALAEQLFDAADYALEALLALQKPPVRQHFEAEKMLMTERSASPQSLTGGGQGYSLAGAGQRTLYDEIIVPADGWYRFTVRHVGLGGDAGMRLRIDNETRHDFHCVNEQPQEEQVLLLLRAGSHQMTWNIENPKPATAAANRPRPARPRPPPGGYPVFDQRKAAPLVRTAAEANAPQLPVPPGAPDAVTKLVDQLNRGLVSMQMRLEYLRVITPKGNPNDLRSFHNLLPERTAAMVLVKQKLATAIGVESSEIDRQLTTANPGKITANQTILADSLAALGMDFHPDLLLGNAPLAKRAQPEKFGAPGVDWISVEGPIAPASPRPIFAAADAHSALAEFLPRAFRRPVKAEELQRHLGLYEAAKTKGQSHPQALKLAFTAALTSPHFLFRDELHSGKLNDHQLASRLSYCLWLSMPDDELRALADKGKLSDETVLRAQVQRLIADPRARAFTSSFLGQWLGFSGLGTEHVPDARRFPSFTPALAESMKLEPILVFEQLLRSGSSLRRLLDGQKTFANPALAALYDLPPLTSQDMQPVSFTDDRRAGLLGMAAVHTASATPNRTSPVIRGKWVLENLLGRKLAEPPADAGQLDDKAGDRGKTLREELAEHRRNETCASCHDKIDPIGFGLENFDAIGRYRSTEAGRPVDASGQLPGGVSFTGPAQLRRLIQERHEPEFLANVTRRLTAFALGRALKPQDEGLIRQLLADAQKTGFAADQLVTSIVLSPVFRHFSLEKAPQSRHTPPPCTPDSSSASSPRSPPPP